MKHRSFINYLKTLVPLIAVLGTVFGVSKKSSVKTDAYTATTSLPTTINLNDCTESEIKSYYSSLSSLSSSELQGNNLLKNLKNILKTNQKYYKYDGFSLWDMYEITDRDWVKSPATELSGYNSSTKTITGYNYGNNGVYIHALYVNRDVENLTLAQEDHQQTQWGINQEHIWPKSQGFNGTGAGGARGDPMHLQAGNGRVNGTEHNNNFYGYVDTSKTYTDPYSAKGFANLKNNLSGRSLTLSSSTSTVFEPQDSDKGDIARAIFYMVARYNDIAGNDTIDQNNPNLALEQSATARSSYNSTSSTPGYMGIMTDLLRWNKIDPVDEYEIHRNNILYRNYTNNRNPFIDYPDWADYIWGTATYSGRTYQSYDSTPTGYVNLSTDKINGSGESGGSGDSGVVVTPTKTVNNYDFSQQGFANGTELTTLNDMGISYAFSNGTNGSNSPKYYTSGSAVRLYSGNTFTVSSSVDIKKIEITYGTSDGSNEITTDVGTFSDNTWTGTSKSVTFTIGGTSGNRRISKITVYLDIVEVVPPTLTGIAITEEPTDKEFIVGDDFNCDGLTITATYDDQSTAIVTPSDISQPDLSSTGEKIITVTYIENGVTKTATYTINVVENPDQSSKYVLNSGKFMEGDYLITGSIDDTSNRVLKNELSNGRFAYNNMGIADSEITCSDNNMVWSISKYDSNYYTIKNKSSNAYLASTGENNKGNLSSTVDDKALWTISKSSANNDLYNFINKYNLANEKNSYLRLNGEYGFACYASGTGKAIQLFRHKNTDFVKADGSATFIDGEVISLNAHYNDNDYSLSALNGTYFDSLSNDWQIDSYYYVSKTNAYTFSIEKDGNYYHLLSSDGYIKSTSGSTNVSFSNEKDDNTKFEISYSDGDFLIKSVSSSRYLWFYQSTSRFAFYATATNKATIEFSILRTRANGEADAWSRDFLNSTENCVVTSWEDLKSTFDDLSDETKDLLKTVAADANVTASLAAQALARYEYILGDSRFNTGLEAFIDGRSVSSSRNIFLSLFGEINSPVMIIVIFSLIGVSAIGAYYFVKRRKIE